MNDYTFLFFLVLGLIIWYGFTKNDLKDFHQKSSYQRFNIRRVYIILIFSIIAWIIKIIRDN
jgi:hypothetical protein